MEYKHYLLFVAFLGIFLGTSIAIEKIQASQVAVAAVEKGLEECPNILNGYKGDAIWVKDCELSLKTQHLLKKEGQE